MAMVKCKAICSGSVSKVSAKTGNAYVVTRFVEAGTLSQFEVFGDLGLPADMSFRDYEFECDLVQVRNVKQLSGNRPKS